MFYRILAIWMLAWTIAACGGAAARKAGYLAKGHEFLAARDFAHARLEFRNALQVDPNDAEASYLAGQASEQLGNLRDAVQLFQTTIQIDPKHLGARAQLAKIYVFAGAPDKAMQLLEPGFAIAPDDADLLTARGSARLQMGDKAGARADAQEAVRLAPANEDAVVLLASIYSQAGDTDQAIDLVNKAARAPAASGNLRLVLAQLYFGAGRHREAVQELTKIVAAEPANFAHRRQLAQMLLEDKDVDEAERVLRAGIAQTPDDAVPKLALANLLATYRSYDVAAAELQRLSAASPNDLELRLALGHFYADHRKSADAETVYRQIIKDDDLGPSGLIARVQLAEVALNSNRADAAAPLLEEVLKKNPHDNDALTIRARLSLVRGRAEAAIADLRAAQRDQPNSILLQRSLAQAYLRNDDPTLAEEALRAGLQNSPNNADLLSDLSRLLVNQGRSEQALPMLEKLIAQQPDNLTALQALFGVQLARKDIAAARRTAGLVHSAGPKLPAGDYLMGVAELTDNKPDAARAAFERALAIAPAAVEPLTALVRLDLSQKRSDQAIDRVDKLITRYPNNAVAHNLRGEVFGNLKRTDEALASFRKAIALLPTWPLPYKRMAAVESDAGLKEDAVKTLQEGIKSSTDAPQLTEDLANLYESTGRADEAIALYENLMKSDVYAKGAANNIAMLLVTHRTDQASLDRARTLAERLANSRNPYFIDTWGWVLYKHGEYASAVASLQKAVDKAPHIPVMLYHLAMALLKSGAPDAARDTLKQALKSGADFPGRDEATATLQTLQPRNG